MSTVRVEDGDGVRTVTMARPERRNALVPEMMDELTVAFAGAGAAGAQVVVLAGEGESFCAGMDLAVLATMHEWSAEQHRVEAERLARMFRALWECEMPTIAVVQGAAVAGGAGLAMICDFTIAELEAVFAFPEVRIGFVPALVSAYLGLMVGNKVARGLLLSGRRFGAEEALRLGLVTEVAASAVLEERLRKLTNETRINSPEGLRATKQMLREQHAAWLDRAVEIAVAVNAASRTTADFREGVASFVEKRKPSWGS